MGLTLTMANAAVTALLLVAGAAKLVAPAPLTRSLTDLDPRLERVATRRVLRGAAGTEMLAALLLVLPGARPAGAGVVAALGAVFAALGTLGVRRRGTMGCGCLGTSGSRPFGWANIAAGVVLVAVAAANLATTGEEPAGFREGSGAVGATIASVVLSGWLHRRLLAVLLLRRPGRAEVSA